MGALWGVCAESEISDDLAIVFRIEQNMHRFVLKGGGRFMNDPQLEEFARQRKVFQTN
jgi:hypothetical protein